MECISLCGIPWLCTLSASAFIELSLHQLDFFLKSFYGDLFQFFYGVHHGCLEIIGSHSTQTVVLLETKYKRPIHGKFSHSNGYFNCVTSSNKVLGWLEKKKKISNFENRLRPFQVGHLRVASGHSQCYCIDWGSIIQAALSAFRHQHLFPGDKIAV